MITGGSFTKRKIVMILIGSAAVLSISFPLANLHLLRRIKSTIRGRYTWRAEFCKDLRFAGG
jgi:hypothetical protein